MAEPLVRRHPLVLIDELALLGYAYAVVGEYHAAEAILDEALSWEVTSGVSVHLPTRINRVFLHLASGAHERVLEEAVEAVAAAPWLERNMIGMARLLLPVALAIDHLGHTKDAQGIAVFVRRHLESTVGGMDVSEFGIWREFLERFPPRASESVPDGKTVTVMLNDAVAVTRSDTRGGGVGWAPDQTRAP